MFWFSFVLAVVAVIFFAVEWFRSRSFIAAGLAVLTVAWVLQLVILSGARLTVH